MVNQFESFCNLYISYLEDLMDLYHLHYDQLNTKSFVSEDDWFYIIPYKRIYNDDTSAILKENYNNIMSDITIYCKERRANWFNTILNFANFLRYAEKCFFYKNSECAMVYSEVLEKEKVTNIYFKRNGYKIKISFEETKIQLTPDHIMTFLDKKEYLKFVTIEVVREYGKQMQNTFNFISNEEPIMNSKSDAILFEKIKKDICYAIKETFEKILDSIIPCFSNDRRETYWKEVIENGLWIRRSLLK